MQNSAMKILVDIGGTYARFAYEDKGKPQAIKKYVAADFKNFEDAVIAYAKEISAKKKLSLRISTAAHSDGKVWRFVNRNKWVIDEAALAKKGYRVERILNDFEAATWGLVGLKDKQILKRARGKVKNNAHCLIGPGTGLGLGYLIASPNPVVRKTMGGHIAAAAITAEQELIIQIIERVKKRKGMVVYEDLVSGFGLADIYRAFCAIDEIKPRAKSPEEILERAQEPQAAAAIKIFHEFFGLFAASATVAGDSFGGLYLMGGMVDRLAEKKLFNFAHFEKFFVADVVPSVRKALDETPVYRVTDPYLALKGLIKATHA